MSDNSKYYDVYFAANEYNPDTGVGGDSVEEGIDAVVAAVRKDMRSAFREEIETLKPSEWRQEGRLAAARDIRAAIDDEHWDFDWRDGMDTAAQIAEGK